MQKNFRYIITGQGAVIFPEWIEFGTVAKGFFELGLSVYSAGEFLIDGNIVSISGVLRIEMQEKMQVLGLVSSPKKDKVIINALFSLPNLPFKDGDVDSFYKQ